jgi:HEAT repeat protein
MIGSRLLFWLMLCLGIVGLTGCGGMDLVHLGSFWEMPWNEKPDTMPGVKPPYERIAELRALATEGANAQPDRQQQISQELAEAIRKETDPIIRVEIVRALAAYPTATATAVIRAAVKDSDSEVRIAACEAWGQRGGPEACRTLGAVLSSDSDIDVRLAATRALGQTRDSAGVASLGVALEDRDPAMQLRAVESLRQITGQDLGNDVNRWRSYVKTGTPPPAEPVSIAQRLRQLF